jgi:serine protease
LQGIAATHGTTVKSVWGGGRYATVRVPPGQEGEFRARLGSLPGVLSVEPNYLLSPALVPDDPYYRYQWNLPLVQADQAWELTQGQGVTVAILDTGVAFEDYLQFVRAPDLARTAFAFAYDALSEGPHPNDAHGHGTHVTGTVAQDTGNGTGAAGVAPGVTIMPVRVCMQTSCPDDAIARGIFWAVDHGARVINMSLAGDLLTGAERDALQYAEDHGVLVVAAAGNGGFDGKGDPYLAFPAAVETVLSVGAVRQDRLRAGYSNYGQGENGSHLDLVAPGGDLGVDQNGDGVPDGVIQNTFSHLCGGSYSVTEFAYCPLQGTSMAAPHVSAAAALLLSMHPALTAAEVRRVLKCSALDLGLPGDDPEYGAGLLQIREALTDSDGDGTVDCLDGVHVSIEAGTVAAGGEATLRLAAHVPPPGLGAFTIDVSYDPSVAQVTACQAPPEVICNPAFSSGLVRLAGTSVAGMEGELVLASLTFQAAGPPGSVTDLRVEARSLADIAGADLLPETSVANGALAVVPRGRAILGDVDCNGAVDALDALHVLRHAAGFQGEGLCIMDGDVNCDGYIDAVDALAILRYVAGLSILPTRC